MRRIAQLAATIGAISVLLTFPLTASADDDERPELLQALGISPNFGRWADSSIPWAYNPTGVPTLFADDAYFVSLLERAFDEIEAASGLRFDFQGIDGTAGLPGSNPNIVAISWANIGNADGAAGASISCSGQDTIDNGYCPYTGGSFRLNNSGSVNWDMGDTDTTEQRLIRVVMHEALHLAGIGHSEEPNSIMFADPYTGLHHLRPDDVAALVGLYGPPATDFDTTVYYYQPPAPGGTVVDSYGVATDEDAFSDIATLGESDTSTFVGVFVDPVATSDFEIVAEDPHGYFHARRTSWSFNQFGSWVSLLRTETIKTVPGTWLFHIKDSAGNLVATDSLLVTTTPVVNAVPDATLAVSDTVGAAPFTVDLDLQILGDADGDIVDAAWHIPTVGKTTVGPAGSNCDPCDESFSSGTSSKSVTFTEPGEYEIFVTVNDNWTRYGTPGSGTAAGPGFRRVFRTVVQVMTTADEIAAFDDVSGDGVPDLATFAGLTSGAPRVQIFSGANGDEIGALTFLNPDWRGIAMERISDSNTDGAPGDSGLAVLLRNPATGNILVHAREVATGNTIDKISFFLPNWTPIDIVVIDDVNGDGNTSDTAIGVLALDEATGKILMQVRSLSTSAKLATISFMNTDYRPVAAAVVQRDGQTPLIGVLGEEDSTGKILVQSRQLSDRALQRNTRFLNFDWRGRDIAVVNDGNNDGVVGDPAWVVLGENINTGVNLAQGRLVSSGARAEDVSMISASWAASRLTSANDISGNGREEVASFARNRSSGKRNLQVRDYETGTVTENISP